MNDPLIPPERLVIENRIGIGNPQRVSEEFKVIGDGIVSNMTRQGFIAQNFSVLDVGCGLGRLARPLTKFLDASGQYHGIDIVRSSIEWCKAHYTGFPNFFFHHAELFNTHYNSKATVRSVEYRFPFADQYFDFIFSTSLFTHMFLDEVDHYLGEMARVLKRGAACWNTFLVIDPVAAPLVQENDGSRPFYLPHDIDGGRTKNLDNPEALIAFYEDRIRAIHQKHGLVITDLRYGPWSGRTTDVRAGGQDVIIARKS